MSTCVKNMRQDRNDAELMSITGSLQNIFINYLKERQRKISGKKKKTSYPAVTALPPNSSSAPSDEVIST